MSRGKRKPALHSVDGKMMTTQEIADMLGLTLKALYVRRSRLGGCSYQCVVDMYRSNQIGSDKNHRYMIEGRWLTQDQIAAELKLASGHVLSTWRCEHRQPDGSMATMEAAVAYYRQYLTGEKVRWQGYGGGRPWKEHLVNGKAWTVLDVMKRFGKSRASVYRVLRQNGNDMGRVIRYFEQRARRTKEIQRRKIQRAEDDIMKILGY